MSDDETLLTCECHNGIIRVLWDPDDDDYRALILEHVSGVHTWGMRLRTIRDALLGRPDTGCSVILSDDNAARLRQILGPEPPPWHDAPIPTELERLLPPEEKQR